MPPCHQALASHTLHLPPLPAPPPQVSQLLSALGEGDPALALACLVVLDVLSAEPTCTPVMMATGWMPIVVPLLSSKVIERGRPGKEKKKMTLGSTREAWGMRLKPEDFVGGAKVSG